MSAQAKAVGFLELNISGFDNALKTAKRAMGAFVAGFGAYKLEQWFVGGIKGAIDFGREMQVASRKMGGFDPGNLLLVQKALEKAGMGAEEARGHISDFISEGRDLSTLFLGSDNYAKALKSAAEEYGSQAGVLSKQSKDLMTVWNTIESIGSKLKTFFLSMTSSFIKPMQIMLDAINQIDLAGAGEKFGTAIGNAASTLYGLFSNGDLWEAAKLGLTIAFQESVNWLIQGLNWAFGNVVQPLADAMASAFDGAVAYLGELFNAFCNNEVVNALWYSLVSAWAHGEKAFLDGVADVVDYFGKGLEWALGKAKELFSALISPDFWKGLWEGLKSFLVQMKDGMITAFTEAFNFVKTEMPRAFRETWEAIKGFFGGDGSGSVGGIVNGMTQAPGAGIRSLGDFFGDIEKNANAKSAPTFGRIADAIEGKGKEWMRPIGGAWDATKKAFENNGAFNTEESRSKLQGLMDAAKKTAEAAGKMAGSNDKPSNIATAFGSGGAGGKVIADSLARIGGGGGFMRVGMSIEAQTMMRAARAAEENARTNKELLGVVKESKPARQVLGR